MTTTHSSRPDWNEVERVIARARQARSNAFARWIGGLFRSGPTGAELLFGDIARRTRDESADKRGPSAAQDLIAGRLGAGPTGTMLLFGDGARRRQGA